jgi:hypothetical protein
MFCNDSLSELDRARVFNRYVISMIKNEHLFDDVTEDKSYLLFTYKFGDDEFIYNGVFDFKQLQDQFEQADEIGENHFKFFIEQLKLTPSNEDNQIYICIFHYGPRNGFHPSIYGFEKTIIEKWDDTLMFGPPPDVSEYNPWFSNKGIKSLLNWERLGDNKAFFDDVPAQYVPVMISNQCKNEKKKHYINIDIFLNDCKKALVPNDMQELIKCEFEKGNLFIVNVINYLINYFLLVRVNKNDTDKYTFTFISSPNDTSLEMPSHKPSGLKSLHLKK